MFACIDENVKFLDLQVHDMSYTTRQSTKKQEELDISGSEGSVHKEKLA